MNKFNLYILFLGLTLQSYSTDTFINSPINTDGDYGYRIQTGENVVNNSIISNNGNYGLYGITPGNVTNSGTIQNKGNYGLIVYNTSNKVLNASDGIISNQGDYGFYGQNSKNLVNDGTIENGGNFGFYLDNGSVGVNNGLIKNLKNYGVRVYNSVFTNNKNGVIQNNGNYGLYLTNNSIATNYGTIKNSGNYSVYVSNTSSFTNHGTIQNNGYAIYLGGNDSLLTLGTSSNISGIVEGNKGTNTLVLVESDLNNKQVGKINFPVNNFSNIDIQSGTWVVSENITLTPPTNSGIGRGEFNPPPFKDAEGTLIIDSGKSLTLQIGINTFSTSTIVAKDIINNGTIIEKPLDSVYVTNNNFIKVPVIYIDSMTAVENKDIKDVSIVNIAAGWRGHYIVENNILYLVLDKSPVITPGYIPPDHLTEHLGGFAESIYFYPRNNIPFLNNQKIKEQQYSWNRTHAKTSTQYAELLSSYGNYNNDSSNPKYSYKSFGVVGGSITPINEYLQWGIGYGYIADRLDYKDNLSSDENINSFYIAPSISYHKQNFVTTFQGTFGYNKHELTRNITDRDDFNLEKSIDANFNSYVSSIGGEIGKNYTFKNYSFYPYIGADYVWDKRDSYTENQSYNGIGSHYAMHINSSTLSTPVSRVGIKGEYLWDNYTFNANLSWYHRFKDYKNYDGYFTFAPDVPMTLQGLSSKKDSALINLNVKKKLRDAMDINFGIYSLFNSDEYNISASLGLEYKF
ncbi:autotransporter domain-containing protein [uncultured Cetobacterium sp.]|uniref:autotransporter outer membrane beta-barrel domain-containing protein n=1 Tax=uncultured Cetobacterium sp. TaxID=527638 RepID=UPI002606EF61|nr:autotransporter domain-containing protein [uncultured Cetobacterium sp.]